MYFITVLVAYRGTEGHAHDESPSFLHVFNRTKSARFEQPKAGPQDETHGCIS